MLARADRVRILAIGDEQHLTSLLHHSLWEKRFAIDIALDGGAGRAMAACGVYDLIVLDLLLPGRDGLSICRGLRAQGVTCPIVLLSSQDTNASIVAGLEAGADAYLTEPIAVEELRARLLALLRRH